MRKNLSRIICNIVLVAGVLCCLPGITLAQKPNIIFMMSDDQGWTDLSVGSSNFDNQSDFYETPNLERMAAQGLSFTDAHANGASCVPSRAALIAGQYSPRTGVYTSPSVSPPGNAPLIGVSNTDHIGEQAVTLAETLKTAGYVTAHFGKFHVANNADEITQWHGFDFNFGGGAAGVPENYFAERSGTVWRFGRGVGPELDTFANPYDDSYLEGRGLPSSLAGTPKHLTDAMGDAAVEFLEAAADPEQLGGNLFYMQIHFYAPHRPLAGRPDLLDKYQRKAGTNPSNVGHDKEPAYAALVESMDEQVGRVLDFLEGTEDPRNPGRPLSENTLVVFFSDNGPVDSSAAPLRGKKGDYFEGGIRVPMLATMRGSVSAGTISEIPIIGVDFYPTFADLAGATLPNATTHPLDGRSLVSVLMGDALAEATLEERPIFRHFPEYGGQARPQSIIRRGDWKLFYKYEDQSYELYDLALDLGESNNLLDAQGGCNAIAAELSVQLRDWLDSVDADYPRLANSGSEVPPPPIIDCGGPPPPPPPPVGPLSVSDVSPDVVAPGSVAQLTVVGSGFQVGAQINLCRNVAGVTIDGVRVIDSGTILVDITVAASAQNGDCGLRVVNPDGESDTLRAAFSTQAGAPPPPGGGPLNITDVSPDVVAPGNSVKLTAVGTGFLSGAQIELCRNVAGVTLDGVSVINADMIEVDITVEGNAQAGDCGFRVNNPDGASNTLRNAFSIQ